jgi:hypothetical protein
MKQTSKKEKKRVLLVDDNTCSGIIKPLRINPAMKDFHKIRKKIMIDIHKQ